jgi:hypothetical protein
VRSYWEYIGSVPTVFVGNTTVFVQYLQFLVGSTIVLVQYLWYVVGSTIVLLYSTYGVSQGVRARPYEMRHIVWGKWKRARVMTSAKLYLHDI